MNTKMVCSKLGVTSKMLRLYEEHGLVCPDRKENNYREYSPEDLLQIETITVLRHLGFSISEIKEILVFDKTEDKRLNMFYLQYKAVEEQIVEMQKAGTALRRTINKFMGDWGCESLTDIILDEHEKRYRRIDYEGLVNSWDFDEMASNFNNRYLNEDYEYQRTVGRIRDIIGDPGSRSFIDIGCGTCNIWQDYGYRLELVAVDKSLPMLLESRKKIPWLDVRMDDILTIDHREYARYDVVVSAFVIHHIEPNDQYKAIDNILELCRENGCILLADRCFRSKRDRTAEEDRLREKNDIEGLDKLNSEYFIYADEMHKYLCMKQYDVVTEYIDDNIVLYIIKK